ncbi:hypothetical protein AB1Y20_012305 [Prymnesium parvum]|uniref:HEAT repeat-containing protein 1 n=1 Tax=Prymnesium parvum TaxID=97485 RepID=A0AB34IQ91_PRYPA
MKALLLPPPAPVYRKRDAPAPRQAWEGTELSIDLGDSSSPSDAAASRLADASPAVRLAALEPPLPPADLCVLMRDVPALARNATHVAELLFDDAWYVRDAATTAISRLPLTPAEVLHHFLPRLYDPCDGVKTTALKQLALLGRGVVGGADMPTVHSQLSDEAWKVREAAILAVHALEPEYLAQRPPLLSQLLSDEVSYVRLAALDVLRSLPLASDVLQLHADVLLRLAQNDVDPEVRQAADECLTSKWPSRPARMASIVVSRV